MIDRDRLAADLIRDEALRLKPYVDTVGKITIGVGRNLSDRGISEPEARVLLANDMTAVLGDCGTAFAWWNELDEVRQRVVANMGFNLGVPRLLEFQRMLLAIEQTKFNAAADEMLGSTWAKQVGQRAVRLAGAMRTGIA